MTVQSVTTRELSRVEFIALIAAMMALNALAVDIMLPALPYMGEALGVANENDRQLVIGAYMLGFGLSQLAFGPISDRFGRRAPLMFGLVVYVIAALAAIVAPTFGILLALRFIQGMGAAGTRVVATSIVRDKFSGRDMAEVMSLIFMVFMAIPVVAPGVGQVLMLTGPWQTIFIFMGVLAALFGVWAYLRLPETLKPEFRRPLTVQAVTEGFRIVFTNRQALFYGLAGMFVFGGLFGFIIQSQQIYVEIYELGVYFPVYFAGAAGVMALSSFLNSRIVRRFGMRRLSHFALLGSIIASGATAALALSVGLPLWGFFILICTIMFMFGWTASNMNSLAMEPLGAVAGTASAVFGFVQTAGGAVLGTYLGQQFDGTVVPMGLGYLFMGLAALVCVLFAERGRLFGVGEAYESNA